MGVKEWFTNNFMGNSSERDQRCDIVDGIIMNEERNDAMEPEKVEPEELEPVEWSLEPEFAANLKKRGMSARTVSEYCIDVKCYGVDPNEITVEQIWNRIGKLAIAGRRRKLTALNAYARWRLTQKDSNLFLVLSNINVNGEVK